MIANEKENREFLESSWKNFEKYFNERGYAGGEIRRGFSELYTMYSPELPVWLGGLYDPRIGGFYYSNSARDNEEFLPDIESTEQALNLIVNTGMLSSSAELPEMIKQGVERFTKSCLDPEDGYFYHPQWGKDICDSRRGRDLNWALSLANKFGYKYDYPTANERLAEAAEKNTSSLTLPEHFTSEGAFLRYLESFDWENNSYYAGNTLAAQGSQIIAAGYAELCADFLNRYQNPNTGFWSEDTGMRGGVNGFLKISSFYRNAGLGIKMPEVAAKSIITCMTSDEIGTTVCHLYNVFNAMDNILVSLRSSGDAGNIEFADKVQDRLLKNAGAALASAKYKTEIFKKPDGGFSFMRDKTSCRSQEAPVALPDTPESDVNASVLCTSGLTNAICRCLGCEDVKVPLYTEFDYQRLLSALS